jgi:ferredoxin
MRAVVNEDMCEGHGKCQLAAPEVFELGDDDVSRVKLDPVPDELREKVERAARLCPRQAITVVEAAAVGNS